MKNYRIFSLLFFVFCGLIYNSQALALGVELGINYTYKKTLIDDLNTTEQEGKTGTVSLYFWERLAVELSYTNGLYVKKERQDASTSSTLQRVTTQWSDIYGCDLIYVFADRKERFQPYVKGGVAYIKKKQTVQIGTDPSFTIEPKPGYAPSYGAGIKFFFTENLSVRASYDIVRTPIDEGTSADDITGRIGLSWML
jgi:opacity protein-like surface antigen